VKLHSPKFEKTLKRGVNNTVRASKELKRDFRAGRQARRYRSRSIVRPAISFALGWAVWFIADRTQHAASGLAIINLWCLLFVATHAFCLLQRLYKASDLDVLFFLPISGATIFRWEFQKFIRGSVMSLIDILAGYGGLLLFLQFSITKCLLVLPIALLTWLLSLTLGLLCAARLPRIPYQLVFVVYIFAVGLICAERTSWGEAIIRAIDQSAPTLNLLLPTGWPASLFQLLFPNPEWSLLLLALPISAIIATSRSSISKLPEDYQLKEPIFTEPADLLPKTAETIDGSVESDGEKPSNLGPTAIEDIIRSQAFVEGDWWKHCGWFETVLWRWLSARERVLCEFAFPVGFFIGPPWRLIARTFVFTVVAGLLLGFIIPKLKYWTLGLGLVIPFGLVLNQIAGSGRAFDSIHCSGVKIPRYAGFAIGFNELAGLLFKCTIVQFPLVSLFALACSCVIAFLIDYSVSLGLVFGLKSAVLLCASRFIFTAFAFSSGTNDNSGFNLRVPILLTVVVGGGMAFVGLCIASLFVPNQLVAWGLVVAAVIEAFAFLRLYGWFYHHSRFDLMTLPSQTSR
jgi:hypothetical protein